MADTSLSAHTPMSEWLRPGNVAFVLGGVIGIVALASDLRSRVVKGLGIASAVVSILFGVHDRTRPEKLTWSALCDRLQRTCREEWSAVVADAKSAYGFAMQDFLVGPSYYFRTFYFECLGIRRSTNFFTVFIDFESKEAWDRREGVLSQLSPFGIQFLFVFINTLRLFPKVTHDLFIPPLIAVGEILPVVCGTAVDVPALVALFTILRLCGRLVRHLPFTKTVYRTSQEACQWAGEVICAVESSVTMRFWRCILPMSLLGITLIICFVERGFATFALFSNGSDGAGVAGFDYAVVIQYLFIPSILLMAAPLGFLIVAVVWIVSFIQITLVRIWYPALTSDGSIQHDNGYPRPCSRRTVQEEPSRGRLSGRPTRDREADSDGPVKHACREDGSHNRRRSPSPARYRRSPSAPRRRRTPSPSSADDNSRSSKLPRGPDPAQPDTYGAADHTYPPSPYVLSDGNGYRPPDSRPRSPAASVGRLPALHSPSPRPQPRPRTLSPAPGPSSRPETRHPHPAEDSPADQEVVYFGEDNCRAVSFGCNPEDKLIHRAQRRISWGRNDTSVKGDEAHREFLKSCSVVQTIFGIIDSDGSNSIPLPHRIGHPTAVPSNYRILQWETRAQMLQFLSAWQDRPRFLSRYIAAPADNLPDAEQDDDEADKELDVLELGLREDTSRGDHGRGGGAGSRDGQPSGSSKWKGKGREES